MYDNRSERGDRPNIDEVVMVKLLVLQQWYGLSDPELERQAVDRLSFMNFLGFPEDIPICGISESARRERPLSGTMQ